MKPGDSSEGEEATLSAAPLREAVGREEVQGSKSDART